MLLMMGAAIASFWKNRAVFLVAVALGITVQATQALHRFTELPTKGIVALAFEAVFYGVIIVAVRKADGVMRFNPAIGAYRAIDATAIRARWERQIVPEDKSAWRDATVADAWINALIASDPESGRSDPPAMRAPNGVLIDVFEIFSGRPIFDAAKITRPTLVIRGADNPTSTDEDARGLEHQTRGLEAVRIDLLPEDRHDAIGGPFDRTAHIAQVREPFDALSFPIVDGSRRSVRSA